MTATGARRRRRRAAVLVAAAAAALAVPAGAAQARVRPVTRVVEAKPGRAVPGSFAGFSTEQWSTADYFGTPGRPNDDFVRLLRTLAQGGAGVPTLHVGGSSADESWWNPDGRPRPAGVENDLTPAWLGTLRAVSERSGARFVLAGNLAIADPSNAAAYLQAATAALPAGALEAFEIGNEPDLYPRGITFQVGKRTITRIPHRPPGYDLPQYLSDLDGYVTALRAARGPGGPLLAAGGFAQASWQAQAGNVLAHENGGIGSFETHAYPVNGCRKSSLSAAVRRRRLLGAPGLAQVARMRRLARVAAAHGAVLRVSELNSAICGGLHGVSDTFASALWGADMLFGLADAGVAGVNVHTWTGAWYAPVEFTQSAGRTVATVHPLLYGMLLFDRAAPAGARFLHVRQGLGESLRVWATRDRRGVVRTVVLNKAARSSRVVRLRLPGKRGRVEVDRLRARSIATRTGVRFGGRSFEAGGFDGRLQGRPRVEHSARSGSAYLLRMPPASAALVTARR